MLGCLILIHGRFKDLVTFHQDVASARPPRERAHPTERRRWQEREKPVLIPCPLSRGARQRCASAQGQCHHQCICTPCNEAFLCGFPYRESNVFIPETLGQNLWSRISHPDKSRPCNSKADLAPKAAMPLMAVLACMASFPPELVCQRTAIVNEIRERCL